MIKSFKDYIDTQADKLNESEIVTSNNFILHVEKVFESYFKVKNLSKKMKIENHHASNFGQIILDRGALIGDPFNNSEYIVSEQRGKFVVNIETETEKLKINQDNIDFIINEYKDMKKEITNLEKLLNKNIEIH